MAGVLQAEVPPGRARVAGAVHPVAVGEVDSDACLAHASVYHVGVRLGDGYCADRGGVQEAVGDVLPVRAAVGGLPYSAAAGPEVEDTGVDRVSGDGYDAPGPVGADAAPFERTFEGFDSIRGDGGHLAGTWFMGVAGPCQRQAGGGEYITCGLGFVALRSAASSTIDFAQLDRIDNLVQSMLGRLCGVDYESHGANSPPALPSRPV